MRIIGNPLSGVYSAAERAKRDNMQELNAFQNAVNDGVNIQRNINTTSGIENAMNAQNAFAADSANRSNELGAASQPGAVSNATFGSDNAIKQNTVFKNAGVPEANINAAAQNAFANSAQVGAQAQQNAASNMIADEQKQYLMPQNFGNNSINMTQAWRQRGLLKPNENIVFDNGVPVIETRDPQTNNIITRTQADVVFNTANTLRNQAYEQQLALKGKTGKQGADGGSGITDESVAASLDTGNVPVATGDSNASLLPAVNQPPSLRSAGNNAFAVNRETPLEVVGENGLTPLSEGSIAKSFRGKDPVTITNTFANTDYADENHRAFAEQQAKNAIDTSFKEATAKNAGNFWRTGFTSKEAYAKSMKEQAEKAKVNLVKERNLIDLSKKIASYDAYKNPEGISYIEEQLKDPKEAEWIKANRPDLIDYIQTMRSW